MFNNVQLPNLQIFTCKIQIPEWLYIFKNEPTWIACLKLKSQFGSLVHMLPLPKKKIIKISKYFDKKFYMYISIIYVLVCQVSRGNQYLYVYVKKEKIYF
jgi:hypothetical protein